MTIKLTAKEIARQDNGVTVAVRLQADGSYLVMLVAVADASVRSAERAATRRDVPAACSQLLRWHDKTGGNSQMASHSRARNYSGTAK